MYQKKIYYLDDMRQGSRAGNAGYARVCLRDDRVTLEIQVKGAGGSENRTAEVRLERGENLLSLGQMRLERGCGRLSGQYERDNIAGSGHRIGQFDGLRIVLDAGRTLYTKCRGLWEESEREESERTEGKRAEDRILQAAQAGAGGQNTETAKPEEKAYTEEKVASQEKAYAEEQVMSQEKAYAGEKMEPAYAREQMMREEYLLSADKWEQLCRTHKQLHPFGKSTYISLTPRDFVVLRREYQELVNNSFLLHGFYNYRHLILGKEMGKDGEVYYLGVPGNYYDREKMVAVMFGFEGFEASGHMQSEQGAERVGKEESGFGFSPGTFGYYMKRVEI